MSKIRIRKSCKATYAGRNAVPACYFETRTRECLFSPPNRTATTAVVRTGARHREMIYFWRSWRIQRHETRGPCTIHGRVI